MFTQKPLTAFKKCLYWDLFWSAFSRIRTEYEEIWSISLYSVRMRENGGQNNSKYGHFSRSDFDTKTCYRPQNINQISQGIALKLQRICETNENYEEGSN